MRDHQQLQFIDMEPTKLAEADKILRSVATIFFDEIEWEADGTYYLSSLGKDRMHKKLDKRKDTEQGKSASKSKA